MGEAASTIVTNGANNTCNSCSTESSPPLAQEDKPPIARSKELSITNSQDPPALEKQATYYTLSSHGVAEQLKSDICNGLTSEDAAARLSQNGPNSIKGAKGVSLWEIFLQQVANALTVVLIAVTALSFAIHDYVEGGVVLAVIILNIVVG